MKFKDLKCKAFIGALVIAGMSSWLTISAAFAGGDSSGSQPDRIDFRMVCTSDLSKGISYQMLVGFGSGSGPWVKMFQFRPAGQCKQIGGFDQTRQSADIANADFFVILSSVPQYQELPEFGASGWQMWIDGEKLQAGLHKGTHKANFSFLVSAPKGNEESTELPEFYCDNGMLKYRNLDKICDNGKTIIQK